MTILSLYTEIDRIYSQVFDKNTNILAVTSANPGEGVSTVAMALVQRSLLAGYRTLYVDMNTHHPTITPFSPKYHNTEMLQPMMASSDGGESIVTGVEAPKSRADIMAVRRPGFLNTQIKEWRKDFDKIIFDAGALCLRNMSNIPADGIAVECDTTILVVLSGVTKKSELEHAHTLLKTLGARVSGVVLNDRFNPSLAFEMLREIVKFKSRLPRLVKWLESKVFKYKAVLATEY